jgi:hypothetical protein
MTGAARAVATSDGDGLVDLALGGHDGRGARRRTSDGDGPVDLALGGP